MHGAERALVAEVHLLAGVRPPVAHHVVSRDGPVRAHVARVVAPARVHALVLAHAAAVARAVRALRARVALVGDVLGGAVVRQRELVVGLEVAAGLVAAQTLT